jgi:fucose 4-O-acetylase-like acetyltransferase
MPAFIFLAGYYSKATRLSERTLQNVATRLLVPYVLFTGIYAVAMFALGHTPTLDLVHPYWLLWFLPALAAWRLFTPLFLNLRWPVGISLVLGLAAGFVSRIDVDFSLSRIFAFAPFFVLGAVTTPEHLHRLQQPLARVAAVGVLIVTAAGAWWLHDDIATRTIFWNGGYEAQGLAPVTGLLVRIAMYVVGLALLLAVLSLTPARRGWWTGVGAASLYVYLLHGFVVRAADAFGWYDHVSSVAGLGVLVLLVAAVTVLLGSPPVRRLTRPVVEPPLGWLLRRDADGHRLPRPPRHSSKSSTTSSESGTDWQASTKPDSSSSGSRA